MLNLCFVLFFYIFTSVILIHSWAIAEVKETLLQCKYSHDPGSHWYKNNIPEWWLLVPQIIRSSWLPFSLALKASYGLLQIAFLIFLCCCPTNSMYLFRNCASAVINVNFWSYPCFGMTCKYFFLEGRHNVLGNRRNPGKHAFPERCLFILLGIRLYVLFTVAVVVKDKIPSGSLVFVSLTVLWLPMDFLNKVWGVKFFQWQSPADT